MLKGKVSMFNHYFASVHLFFFYGPVGVGRILTHTDGVGGVQFAAQRALAVEGPGHVAAHAVDTRAGEALVDI